MQRLFHEGALLHGTVQSLTLRKDMDLAWERFKGIVHLKRMVRPFTTEHFVDSVSGDIF